MIITRLALHNVGAFRGAHSIDLAPSTGRPVVLVGALNGSGKTTLLESVQLALYGRSARHLLEDSSGYADYLGSLINTGVNPRDGASVELNFRHKSGGKDTDFRVLRTWSIAGSALREDLQISCNGEVDPLMSERWTEFVNTVLPVQIADLFLFDGERVKALAEPETSAELLRTGVHALLGLDLVDNLTRSLSQLERRLQRAKATTETEATIRALGTAVESLEIRRREIREREVKDDIDATTKALARAREELHSEGGDLLLNRDALEQEVQSRRLDFELVDSELRELASDVTPLRLVEGLAADTNDWALAISGIRQDELIRQRVAQIRRRLLATLGKYGVDKGAAEGILKAFVSELAPRTLGPVDEPWMQLLGDAHALDPVPLLKSLGTLLPDSLRRWEESAERVSQAERRLDAVPAAERVQHLIKAVSDAEVAVVSATDRYNSIVREREAIERELRLKREEVDQAKRAYRDLDRVSLHSVRARDVLAGFRATVAKQKLHALELRIASNFKQLARKTDLLADVRINPDSYQMTVLGRDGHPIRAERLSAGERQLLAVAVLWSLGQASGRHLPVIIDTPLGRLDSVHRSQLVENYFPRASHQVILLSTDEEVHGQYHAALRPYVSREYLITHREKEGTSAFSEGYFREEAAA